MIVFASSLFELSTDSVLSYADSRSSVLLGR